MTVRELVKKTYLERDQIVELYDYNIDENGNYDIMIPPMIWGDFSCNVAKECEISHDWNLYKNKNVVYFSFKENKLYICIDYDNKGGYLND